jgi:hypothetical protein
MKYTIVFDISDKGFNWIYLFPLIFVIIGVITLFLNRRLSKKGSSSRIYTSVICWIVTAFSLLVFLFIFPRAILKHNKTVNIIENEEYAIVEGVIDDFEPMPYEGHAQESFTVKGIYFEYSDYFIDGGFNQTSSHGGPITENGQRVRISYIQEDFVNQIIRIEIAK